MTGTRILALDPGTKRIGVALSDELGWTAQPLETYERRSVAADVAHIQQLVDRHQVKRIVMGFPVRLDGTLGPAALQVQEFIGQLKHIITIPIVVWDERMTTKAAEEILIQANMSRRKRKGTVDRVAAAILLQSYLESLGADGGAVGAQPDATDSISAEEP